MPFVYRLLSVNTVCWEFIIEHVHYNNFGTRDSFTCVIFGINIKVVAYHFCSLGSLNKDRLTDLLLLVNLSIK